MSEEVGDEWGEISFVSCMYLSLRIQTIEMKGVQKMSKKEFTVTTVDSDEPTEAFCHGLK